MRSVISVPMTDGSSVDRFLATVPSFARFGQILDPQLYAALPDDWVVGLADVVSSTQAIEAGHYKNVNMAGAAVIAAVSNALGNAPYPFVFGGDGASFALPSDRAAAARQALACTAAFVVEVYGLELRVAEVPVAAIRAAGFDIRVARFAASPDLNYAMFSGGGLAWAETRMKAGIQHPARAARVSPRPEWAVLPLRGDASAAWGHVVNHRAGGGSQSGRTGGHRLPGADREYHPAGRGEPGHGAPRA